MNLKAGLHCNSDALAVQQIDIKFQQGSARFFAETLQKPLRFVPRHSVCEMQLAVFRSDFPAVWPYVRRSSHCFPLSIPQIGSCWVMEHALKKCCVSKR